jgi:hypothetical protein
MVLKRKKIQDSPVGNTSRRKGYRSRSSINLKRKEKRMSNRDLERAQDLYPELENFRNYYKDLIK